MIRRVLAMLLLHALCSGAGADGPVTIGESRRIHSSLLHEDRRYNVSLPASYAWAVDRRYPVLYLLDGQTHFRHTAGSVDFLGRNGEIPEMIVVAIDSTVRVRDFTQTDWPSAWIGGGGAGNFKRFLSDELIPQVERTYRTDGFRVLSGHSAGGQFALYCLTSEPALFRAYIALSPSLDWDDNLPQRSLDKALEATQSLEAYLYVARSDDSGRALADYEKLVETLRSRTPRGFRWKSQPYPEETHSNVALLAQIDALRSLYAGYRYHGDMLEKGLPYAEKHFEEVSKTLGWPIAIPERVINQLAYDALSRGRTQDALVLFRRNVEAHPDSANAYDGLADGYAEEKSWAEAARASKKALALATRYGHPNKEYFRKQLKKMNARLEQERRGAKK